MRRDARPCCSYFMATTAVVSAGAVGFTIAADFDFITKKAIPPPIRPAPATPPTTAPTITPVLSSDEDDRLAWDCVVVGAEMDCILTATFVPVVVDAVLMLLVKEVTVAAAALVWTLSIVTVDVAESTVTTNVICTLWRRAFAADDSTLQPVL